MTATDPPRIYVACLASYNAGTLHGAWVDCDQDADAIRDEIVAMLRASPYPNVRVGCPDCDGEEEGCATCEGTGKVPSAEEWAIHDYEFGGVKLNEHEDVDQLAALAEHLAGHGDAYAAWVNHGNDYDSADRFQEAYRGRWDSLQDYAENLLDDTGAFEGASDMLKTYFDYEAFARDLELGGDVWTADAEKGGVHVFDAYA